jgi:putative PIN family toxin of toxin-antitoxin system
VRIFLDTTVLVSALTARGLTADLVRAILRDHELLTGEVNLVELRRVLGGRFRASAAQLQAVEGLLRQETVVPKPAKPSTLRIRDPDDRWVLASAIAGGADMLVTGDKDLLSVADQSPLPIVDPRGCWERLRGRR